MIDIKVFASQISNLTDARYFSAMGADYLGFYVDPSTEISKVKEIMDWVEGPIFVGEWSEMTIDLPLSIVDPIFIQHWLFQPFFQGKYPAQITPIISLISGMNFEVNAENFYVYKLEQNWMESKSLTLQTLLEVCRKAKVFIDGIDSADDLKWIANEVNPFGIILKGGEEEKVGFKSYDQLDELFDVLST